MALNDIRSALVALVLLGTAGTAACGAEATPEQCLSGVLTYSARDAEQGVDLPLAIEPARRIDWELVEPRPSGPVVLERGQTDAADGSWEACAPAGASRQMTFRSSSAATRVETVRDSDGEVFTHSTDPTSETTDFGHIVVGDEDDPSQAWKIVDTLGVFHDRRSAGTGDCWTASMCTPLVVRWAPEPGSDASYFDEATGQVILGHTDAQSKHVILHEAGHWFQSHLAEGGGLPEVIGCEHHAAPDATTPTCAWTEGFAVAVAAHLLGDTRHVYDDGEEIDTRGVGEIPGWDDGDTVEGRVAGALLAIWDRVDGGDWTSTMEILAEPIEDMRAYVDARIARDPDQADAITEILAEHTIVY